MGSTYRVKDEQSNEILKYDLEQCWSLIKRVKQFYVKIETCKDPKKRTGLAKMLVETTLQLSEIIYEPLVDQNKKKQALEKSNDFKTYFKGIRTSLGVPIED